MPPSDEALRVRDRPRTAVSHAVSRRGGNYESLFRAGSAEVLNVQRSARIRQWSSSAARARSDGCRSPLAQRLTSDGDTRTRAATSRARMICSTRSSARRPAFTAPAPPADPRRTCTACTASAIALCAHAIVADRTGALLPPVPLLRRFVRVECVASVCLWESATRRRRNVAAGVFA